MGSGRLTRGDEPRDEIRHGLGRRLAFLTLRDRLHEHLFGLRVGLERFVTLECQDGDGRALREFCIRRNNSARRVLPIRTQTMEGPPCSSWWTA